MLGPRSGLQRDIVCVRAGNRLTCSVTHGRHGLGGHDIQQQLGDAKSGPWQALCTPYFDRIGTDKHDSASVADGPGLEGCCYTT